MVSTAASNRLQQLIGALPELGEDGYWLADLIRAQLEASERVDGRSLRAQLIQDLAAFYPGRPSRRAKDIDRDARRYATTCWPRDQTETEPPEHHRGKPEAVLFELHRNAERGGGRWPLAWRRLTSILQFAALANANGSAASSAHDEHQEGAMKNRILRSSSG